MVLRIRVDSFIPTRMGGEPIEAGMRFLGADVDPGAAAYGLAPVRAAFYEH